MPKLYRNYRNAGVVYDYTKNYTYYTLNQLLPLRKPLPPNWVYEYVIDNTYADKNIVDYFPDHNAGYPKNLPAIDRHLRTFKQLRSYEIYEADRSEDDYINVPVFKKLLDNSDVRWIPMHFKDLGTPHTFKDSNIGLGKDVYIKGEKATTELINIFGGISTQDLSNKSPKELDEFYKRIDKELEKTVDPKQEAALVKLFKLTGQKYKKFKASYLQNVYKTVTATEEAFGDKQDDGYLLWGDAGVMSCITPEMITNLVTGSTQKDQQIFLKTIAAHIIPESDQYLLEETAVYSWNGVSEGWQIDQLPADYAIKRNIRVKGAKLRYKNPKVVYGIGKGNKVQKIEFLTPSTLRSMLLKVGDNLATIKRHNRYVEEQTKKINKRYESLKEEAQKVTKNENKQIEQSYDKEIKAIEKDSSLSQDEKDKQIRELIDQSHEEVDNNESDQEKQVYKDWENELQALGTNIPILTLGTLFIITATETKIYYLDRTARDNRVFFDLFGKKESTPYAWIFPENLDKNLSLSDFNRVKLNAQYGAIMWHAGGEQGFPVFRLDKDIVNKTIKNKTARAYLKVTSLHMATEYTLNYQGLPTWFQWVLFIGSTALAIYSAGSSLGIWGTGSSVLAGNITGDTIISAFTFVTSSILQLQHIEELAFIKNRLSGLPEGLKVQIIDLIEKVEKLASNNSERLKELEYKTGNAYTVPPNGTEDASKFGRLEGFMRSWERGKSIAQGLKYPNKKLSNEDMEEVVSYMNYLLQELTPEVVYNPLQVPSNNIKTSKELEREINPLDWWYSMLDVLENYPKYVNNTTKFLRN